MANNTTLSALNRPREVGPLIVEPLTRASVALQVSTLVRTASPEYRLPKITGDPSADWIGPNQQIPSSEATGDEIVVTPQKLAGLSFMANELVQDTDPAAHGIVADRLAADSARKIDQAFFASGLPANANRPLGLEAIPAASLTKVVADPTSSVDVWTDAYFAAQDIGLDIDYWVTTSAVAKALAKMKTGTGSNAPLLNGFVDGKRVMSGAPVLVSPYVTAGTVWGISRSRVFSVLRKDIDIEFDASMRFDWDQTVIRTTLRIAFGYPSPASVVRIKV